MVRLVPEQRLTLQIHHHGAWHDAALLTLYAPEAGLSGASRFVCEIKYWSEFAAAEAFDVRDRRALSVRAPVNLEIHSAPTWPAFLLDLLAQGNARDRLSAELGFSNPDLPEVETPLLMRSAGSPIGNIRVREAWEAEQERLRGQPCAGLALKQIEDLTDEFLDVADRFALVASGSSGVQGEWPKMLMSQSRDGLWYPDPVIPDGNATDHIIVKRVRRAGDENENLILGSEGPYLEVARAFGLRVGKPLTTAPKILIIPRFDREVTPTGVVRLGQESIVAAAGIPQFGHRGTHEEYLAVIKRHCADPVSEVIEYVLRDALNLAMGNPDNHGRNTALQKAPDGTIRLAPLFDFAPMRLNPDPIMRSTRWECLGHADLSPDWRTICRVAAEDIARPEKLESELIARLPLFQGLREIARKRNVPESVIERALVRCGEIADGIARLVRGRDGCP